MTGLWIERIDQGNNTVALRVAGQLVGSWVDVLERECASVLHAGRPLALELSGLTFMSSAGAELLRDMRGKGLRILGLTPILLEILDDGTES